MHFKTKPTAEEIRARILEVAEEMFRRVGYAKTAVADIAHGLGMSPANVYRFFASKSEINQAIARRILRDCHAQVEAIAAMPMTAADRLRQAALAIHRFNKTQLTEERRIHDMVEVAMAENWDVVHAHKQALAGIFARIIADGIAADEFPPQDALAAAEMFKLCHISVFHPTLIAHCAGDDQERQTREITEFVLRGLMARGG